MAKCFNIRLHNETSKGERKLLATLSLNATDAQDSHEENPLCWENEGLFWPTCVFIVLFLTILFQTNGLVCHYSPPSPGTGPPFFETVTNSVPKKNMKTEGVSKRAGVKSVAHFHCGCHCQLRVDAEHGGKSIRSISKGLRRFKCHPGEWQVFFLTFLEL